MLNKFNIQLKEKFEVKLFYKIQLILSMLVKKVIKYKIFYFGYMYYIWNLLFTYDIIEINLVNTLIVKRSNILFNKDKDTKFDIINY